MDSVQPQVEAERCVLKKESIAGGPVTCVSLLSDNFCWVARGSFLQLATLEHPRKSTSYNIFPEGGTIHGVKHGGNLSVAFGGRQVAVLSGGRSADEPIQLASIRTLTSEPNTFLVVSDWIWDVKMIEGENDDSRRLVLALALANNACEVWILQSYDLSFLATRERRIIGATRSITYSMCFFGWNGMKSGALNDLIVASGTVSNEILVWTAVANETSLLQSTPETCNGSTQRIRNEHCLQGHLGVIHAVRFDESGELLASASDDRSVRLWQKNLDDGSWSLLWTAWAHKARVWNVAFSSKWLVSCGEDATAKICCKKNGSILGELRVHNCQSLWSIDICDNLALIGHNDGTAKLWDLNSGIVEKPDDDLNQAGNMELATTLVTYHVPDDRPGSPVAQHSVVVEGVGLKTESTSAKRRKMKAKIKIKAQVICGIAFYDDQYERKRLLVATRSGSLFSLALDTRVWETCEPWCVPALDLVDADGTCIAVNMEGVVAVGTTKGDIVFVCVACNSDEALYTTRRKCSARAYLSIKSLAWLDDRTLLSFHIKGIVLIWKLHDNANDLPVEHHTEPFRVLNMTTMAVPTCFAVCEDDDNIFIGDSRGNIAMFSLGTTSRDGVELTPITLANRVHKKEYVNDIICLNNKIISIGNDGFIRQSILNDSGELETILSVPLSSMSGPTYLFLGTGDTMVVAGYQGNSFLALDISSGYELFRVETGGRQRARCCFVAMRLFPACYSVAICVNREDGLNDIAVQSYIPEKLTKRIIDCNIGASLHGEPVFDLCLFSSRPFADYAMLLSGSEDCTARVSIVKESSIIASEILPTQTSCIRAVASSRYSGRNTTLLVVCGGQMNVDFYSFVDNEAGPITDTPTFDKMTIRSLGTGYFPFKSSVDPRMNAVCSVPFADDERSSHVVATGDSDGSVCVFMISDQEPPTQQSLKGHLLCTLSRAVLSIDMIVLKESSYFVIIAGATDGSVTIWALPLEEPLIAMAPLGSYDAHQVGTNSVSSLVLDEHEGHVRMRICSGGDDQSLTICTIDLILAQEEENVSPALHIVCFSRLDVASASAIKGVKLIDAYHILSVGYSQRLALWKLMDDEKSLKLVSVKAVDVADVNYFSVSLTNNLVAVGGMGVEFFTLPSYVDKSNK